MAEQLKIDNDVINHLLFHKALIDDNGDASQINKYISMIESGNLGENASIDSPFDRSIAILFDLVINQDMNPWNIDLVHFSSMYLKRAKKEKIDLVTAGRIIYMAWKVLRLQSDDLVGHMETDEPEESFGFDWTDLPTGAYLHNDDGYSYANLIKQMPQPPLTEPIRREAERKVTLMELISAFDEARREAEEYQLLDKARRKERARLSALARKHMKGTAHEDHLEEDVTAVWEKICSFSEQSIELRQLYDPSNAEDRIRTLLSVLFLAYDNKIQVRQRRFPYGKIYIKILNIPKE